MATSHLRSIPTAEDPRSSREHGKRSACWVALVLIGAFALGVGGCVTDGYVGVSTYPSYEPYYGYYGYSGVPYYGYGGIYTRNIIVRGRRYSGGFGRQHFSHYRRGRDRTELSRPSRPVRQQPGVRSRGSGAARDRGPR